MPWRGGCPSSLLGGGLRCWTTGIARRLVARRLIYQLRSWVEPCQSFEKNILGLDRMFLNSLRLTWTVSLLADAVGLLRALALLNSPLKNNPLQELIPTQMAWSWGNLGQPEK
jgi:hypothetical protein